MVYVAAWLQVMYNLLKCGFSDPGIIPSFKDTKLVDPSSMQVDEKTNYYVRYLDQQEL